MANIKLSGDRRNSDRLRICPNCGAPFIPKRDNSNCCCIKCSKAWYQRKQRRINTVFTTQTVENDISTCQFNRAVICGIRNCSKCGWNPDVAAARLSAISGRLK